MSSTRDDNLHQDLSDTLIQHRAILESQSIFRQGLTLVKIAYVVLVMFVKFKLLDRLEARRRDRGE